MKVPVLYYSQVADECVNLYDSSAVARAALKNRQFEWTDCGGYYDAVETGLVEWELNDEYLPVAVGGELTTNRGVAGENFRRWFKNVEGVSAAQSGEITLSEAGDGLVFEATDFQPVEGLFTMSFGLPFMVLANGKEKFEITADDDTFVFAGNKLVIDMGGIHGATTGRFVINEKGEVYAGVEKESLAYTGVNLKEAQEGVVRVFHANRDSKSSVFSVRIANMVLNTVEGTETVAYDPTNPGYMAPLGESLVVGLNQSKIMATANAVKGLSFGMIAIAAGVIICAAVRYWRRGHNRER